MSPAKRVLVTGAGGFVGRWSIGPLLNRGYEVHAVLSGSHQRRAPQELREAAVHFADLLDAGQTDALLARVAPTHLLHFAWIATPGVYWHSAENFRWLDASRNLLRRFRAEGGARAVMAGSSAEYDWSRVGLCIESSSPLADAAGGAPTAYAAGKLAMQKDLAQFAARERLSAAWGRIFFQFGPYEHPDRLVPSVIRHLLLNQEAPCTHGRQIRSFLHVADVGEAFAQLLDSEVQGPVNIGSADRIKVADLIERIAQQIGRPELVRLGARETVTEEPPLLVPDVHRLHDEVQWRPRLSLGEAIGDTIGWWRTQTAMRDGS